MARTLVVLVVATLYGMETGGRTAPLPPATTLQFSGYTWEVRSGAGGQGRITGWRKMSGWMPRVIYI